MVLQSRAGRPYKFWARWRCKAGRADLIGFGQDGAAKQGGQTL